MEVQKCIVVKDSTINICTHFRTAMVENCSPYSEEYKHKLAAFKEMLKELISEAFELGQANPEDSEDSEE